MLEPKSGSIRNDTERLVALTDVPLRGESAHITEDTMTLSEVDRLLSEIIQLDDRDLDSDTNPIYAAS